MDDNTADILSRVDPRTRMLGVKIETAEGPFRLKEANRSSPDEGGSLDLAIVARLQDGREVVVGELWAVGPASDGARISLDPCGVAKSRNRGSDRMLRHTQNVITA